MDMSLYRNALPQLGDTIFFTDGGMETSLIFHDGLELPDFASFVLLEREEGLAALRRYYAPYARTAQEAGCGFVLESPTWRASTDWGERLGYSRERLGQLNRESIRLLESLRDELQTTRSPMVISGCIGPRGDGYRVDEKLSVAGARQYHAFQAEAFAGTAADMVSAVTMTHAEEAIGITLACRDQGLPAVISFTTETDGRLPSGQGLREAIEQVDAETDESPAYYMINCAHPDHFSDVLAAGEDWTSRIRGIRANASRMSHAELDEAEELDAGDPREFGQLYRRLRDRFPGVTVLGGCCGTDHRHVEQVRVACV
jgi:homocysteine S-methyltransferase